MATKVSPTALRRRLGAELRRLREHARRTVADVAGELGWSESKLSRIETANSGIRRSDLDLLLAAYGIGEDERARLTALAGQAGQARLRTWWESYSDALPDAYETYIALEAEASAIFTYEAQVVPGLLQTDEYANAIPTDGGGSDPEVINQRVLVRLARQAVLTRDPPPQLWAILDEAALRRPIGGPDVMRRQLFRLVEMGDRPTIRLQVLPFSAGAHQALAGSFIVLEFADGAQQSLVYSEGLTGGVIRTKRVDVENYLGSFEALKAAALAPDESLEFIDAVAHGRK